MIRDYFTGILRLFIVSQYLEVSCMMHSQLYSKYCSPKYQLKDLFVPLLLTTIIHDKLGNKQIYNAVLAPSVYNRLR